VASQLLNLKSVRSSRVATATLVMVLLLRPADAQVELCQKDATDDTLRSIPQSLVPAAKQLFGLVKVPDQQIRRSTVFRCAEGRVLLCNYGANLPCGKAKADRHPRGVVAWCRTRMQILFRIMPDRAAAFTIGAALPVPRRSSGRSRKLIRGVSSPAAGSR
jgi:hypothetical protein